MQSRLVLVVLAECMEQPNHSGNDGAQGGPSGIAGHIASDGGGYGSLGPGDGGSGGSGGGSSGGGSAGVGGAGSSNISPTRKCWWR